MRWLVRGLLAVGGWLYCFQWLSPALADNNSPCSILRSQTGQLFPNNSLATRLASEGTESFFEVKCSGRSSGILRLSIDGSRTRAHNDLVKIRLVTANGIFSSGSSEFTSDALRIPYSLLDGNGIGKVMYQVQVSAPDRRLLQAARDYSVAVSAELLP
jgi:hypothetical protein